MKIEVGKYYKTRGEHKCAVREIRDFDGVICATHYINGSEYPFFHYSDGSANISQREYDIIAEWQDEPTNTITTHGTWSPRGTKPKTQYVYELEFELDQNGHPDWSTAKVRGK